MATSFHDDVSRAMSRPDLLAWGTVRSGLAVNFSGGLMIFLCAGLLIVVQLVSEGTLHGASVLTMLVAILSGLGVCAGVVLGIFGACMGSAAPRESGARSWAYGTCAFATFAVAALVVLVVAILDQHQIEDLRGKAALYSALNGETSAPEIDQRPAFKPEEIRVISFVLEGVFVLGVCCYLLFLHSIARHFRRDGLAVGVICFLMFSLLFVAGMNVLATSRPKEGEEIERIKLAAWLVLGGVGIIGAWGLAIVGMVRGVLTQGMLRG